MATNNILPFAQGTGANVQSQADYSADQQRIIGNQPGIARSAFVNKALLQASVMASGLAQFIADGQSDDVTDAKTPAEIAEMLKDATADGFAFNIAQNGCVRLPAKEGDKRLMIQWGKTATIQPNTSVTHIFAYAFTEECYVVVGTINGENTNTSLNVYNISATQATFMNDRIVDTGTAYAAPAFFIAIGV